MLNKKQGKNEFEGFFFNEKRIKVIGTNNHDNYLIIK